MAYMHVIGTSIFKVGHAKGRFLYKLLEKCKVIVFSIVIKFQISLGYKAATSKYFLNCCVLKCRHCTSNTALCCIDTFQTFEVVI